MMDWQKVTPELRKKLDPAHVAQRKQGGAQVSYVEGWHVIAELNRIFGHGEWTRETLDVSCVSEREAKIGRDQKDGWRVTYTARVRVTVAGVVRDGCGAGHGIGTDLGECHESAIKEAETDAMKRAAMTFGNPFGLALYDKARANVGVDAPPFDPAACDTRLRAGMDKLTNKAEATEWWKNETPALLALKEADLARYDKLRADLAAKNLPEKAPAPSTDMIPGAFQEA